MCNQIRKIAKQGRYQWIGVCAHGAAHIFWKSTHFCIPGERLEYLMQEALDGNLPIDLHGEDYLLWLGGAAIKLNERDYLDITDLFVDAAEGYSKVPVEASTSRPTEALNDSRPANAVLH